PEGRIEHRDILRLECRLVALEQLSHLGNDLGDIRDEVLHAMFSTALATATSIASCPCAPRMERPTGRPLMVAPGMLTCGTPVRPPCAARHVMRSRTMLSAEIA